MTCESPLLSSLLTFKKGWQQFWGPTCLQARRDCTTRMGDNRSNSSVRINRWLSGPKTFLRCATDLVTHGFEHLAQNRVIPVTWLEQFQGNTRCKVCSALHSKAGTQEPSWSGRPCSDSPSRNHKCLRLCWKSQLRLHFFYMQQLIISFHNMGIWRRQWFETSEAVQGPAS